MLRTGQQWVNLLSNALKYSQKKSDPVVKIGSQSGPQMDENTYFVTDNGVGFDMKYSHKIFGVFQRLHSEDDFEGTGVGLAIVHRIILRHQGKIWFESVPNQGTTFYFCLKKGL